MSEQLLRAMRHVLLERLRVTGAQTLAELTRPAPYLLFLPLSPDEVHDALDSCRRHRLVEPLDPSIRELGHAEWGLTELGRKAARSPVADVVDRLAQLVALIVVVTGVFAGLVGAATGLSFDLESLDPTAAIALLVLAVMAGQLLLGTVQDRRYRVSGARIARDWERLAAERPLMHRLHTRKRRLGWPGTTAAVIALVVAVLNSDPGPVTIAVWVVFFGFSTVTQVMVGAMTSAAQREALPPETGTARPAEPPVPPRASSPA